MNVSLRKGLLSLVNAISTACVASGRKRIFQGAFLQGAAVSASDDKTLKVWEVKSGRELRTLKGHSGSVNGVALSGDGRLAVSASDDKTLKVWEVESGRELRTMQGHSGYVYRVALSGDGRLAVSTSHDKTLKVWEVTTGVPVTTFTCEDVAISCAFSDVHKLIVAGDDRGRVYSFRLEEPKPKK